MERDSHWSSAVAPVRWRTTDPRRTAMAKLGRDTGVEGVARCLPALRDSVHGLRRREVARICGGATPVSRICWVAGDGAADELGGLGE